MFAGGAAIRLSVREIAGPWDPLGERVPKFVTVVSHSVYVRYSSFSVSVAL